jgi:hypothetical protein
MDERISNYLVQAIDALQKEKEMFKSHQKYIFLPLTILATGLSLGGKLLAQDNCKNVMITISNQTGDEIKVKKFEYRDFDKGDWKVETGIFGVDGFDKLEPGKSNSWTRDLEKVSKDTTEFRVTYSHHVGGSKWGSDILATTPNFTCTEGLKKTVTLTK